MKNTSSKVDAAFVERQRQALLKLRAQLVADTSGTQADEADVRSTATAGEYEDDAQRLDALERDGNLVARDLQRLKQVDRALQKIAEGSYGLSDASGEPIPRDRLAAAPDALYTLSEERGREVSR